MIEKYTTTQAATVAGVSRYTINAAIKSGTLHAAREGRNTRNGRAYLIHPADLYVWMQARRRGPRRKAGMTKLQAARVDRLGGGTMVGDGNVVTAAGVVDRRGRLLLDT